MAGREREVSLKIKAQDEYSAQLKKASEAVDRLRAAQERTRGHRDSVAAERQAIEQLQASYNEAAARAARYAEALNRGVNASRLSAAEERELRSELQETRDRMRSLSAEIERKGAALDRLQGKQRNSFAAFSRSAEAMRQEAAAAREATKALRERADAALGRSGGQAAAEAPAANRLQARLREMNSLTQQAAATRKEYDALRASTAALGKQLATTSRPTNEMVEQFERAKASLAELRAEMARQQPALQQLSGGFQRFARNTASTVGSPTGAGARDRRQARGGVFGAWSSFVDRQVAAMSSAHGRGPLGLRPYELQNLSYQINDVVSGLATGQRPMQIFAQQAGQIAQIFPRAVVSIVRMAPALVALTAAVVPLVSAFNRLRETQKIVDDFSRSLMATADAARYNPAALTNLVRDLQRVGVSAEQATASIKEMVRADIPVERMREYAFAAAYAAEVTGVDFSQAVSDLQAGFDGTLESLMELNEQYRFLTADQAEHVVRLHREGRALEATDYALGVYSDKMEDVADKSRGPWAQAKRDLANAWRDLLDWLGTTGPIQIAIAAVQGLANGIGWLASALNRLRGEAGNIPLPESEPEEDPRAGPSEHERAQEAIAAELAAREATLNALEETGALVEAANEEIARQREDAARRLGDALARIEEENADRAFRASIATLGELEQKTQTALRRAEAEMAAAGGELSDEQRESIIATTAALHEQEEAAKAAARAARDAARGGGGRAAKGKTDEQLERERRNELEKALNDLLEVRRLLMEQIDFYDAEGDSAKADALRAQMEGTNEQIERAIANLRTFWQGFDSPEAQAALLRLDALQQQLAAVSQQALTSADDINDMLAQGGANALDRFAEATMNGQDAITAFRDSFMQMAADFLRQIALMIAQQAILNALQASGGGGIIASAVNAVVRHGGGMASGNRTRAMPAAVFANAPRFHTGGLVGLRPDEVPAVLQRGEEVLRRNDPRHALNGGNPGGGTNLNAKIVNVIDPTEILSAALATEAGEKVIMNFMSGNARRLSAVLEG